MVIGGSISNDNSLQVIAYNSRIIHQVCIGVQIRELWAILQVFGNLMVTDLLLDQDAEISQKTPVNKLLFARR